MTRHFAFALVPLLITSSTVFADAPNIQTPAPLIHLADNLDEVDQLGWCIDTQGRGFGAFLHAHSCKPRGGDVQFGFQQDTGLIRSVAYDEYCMVYDPSQSAPMGLVTCDAANPDQIFAHDETGQITLAADPSLCLSVGASSASAGPFMSRALDMHPCQDTPDALKVWKIIQ